MDRYFLVAGIMGAGSMAVQAGVGEGMRIGSRPTLSGFTDITNTGEFEASIGGGAARPLTRYEVDAAIRRLREGQSIAVQDFRQMRQIQAELGQLGVSSQSSSVKMPLRATETTSPPESPYGTSTSWTPGTEDARSGTGLSGRGDFRMDPKHLDAQSGHAAFDHINITLPNGKKVEVIVTGILSDLGVTIPQRY
jgi:hypothetical protein